MNKTNLAPAITLLNSRLDRLQKSCERLASHGRGGTATAKNVASVRAAAKQLAALAAAGAATTVTPASAKVAGDQLFRVVFESISVGVALVNMEGRVVKANQADARFLNYTTEELEGMHFREFTHPDDIHQDAALFEELVRGLRDSYFIDKRYVRRDGRIVWGRLCVSLIRDWKGRPQYAAIVCEDITDEREAKEALRQSERVFESHYQNAPVPTYSWRRTGDDFVLVNYNRAAVIMTQERVHQLLGKRARDVYVNAPEILRDLDACFAEQRTLRREIRYQMRSTSEWKDFDVHYVFVPPDLVMAHTEDITERKAAERAVQESEARFRQLAENIPEVFWMGDARGHPIYVSPAFERIWGRKADLLEQSVSALVETVHPEDRERLQRALREQAQGKATEIEYRILRPDDSTRWIRDCAFPIKDESGSLYRVAGIATDITERKSSEARMRQYAERLQTLSRRLLEAQEQERRHIARELHDQVGQDLTVVEINLQSLLQQEEHKDSERRLQESIGIVERVLQQVRDLSLDLRPSMLDDLGLIAALRWYLGQQARRCGFAPVFEAQPWNFKLDPTVESTCFRIAQEALTNIARHARAKNVRVELSTSEPCLELIICDDGVGFDAVRLGDKAHSASNLGLLGMEERASLAGGHLAVTSQPGKGTTVSARFPSPAANCPDDPEEAGKVL